MAVDHPKDHHMVEDLAEEGPMVEVAHPLGVVPHLEVNNNYPG